MGEILVIVIAAMYTVFVYGFGYQDGRSSRDKRNQLDHE